MVLPLQGRFPIGFAPPIALIAQWIERLSPEQKVAGSTPAQGSRVFQPKQKEINMTMSDETRVISSHALTVDGMSQPQVQQLNLPTGFNGYRKDAVEQYVNGLETQIWNLQRQLTEKNMVLDKRQSELGKREQEAESLRQQIERLNADLQDARQASENPMQELGTSLGKEFQTLKNTYESKKREELEHARTQAEQILQQAKDESQKRLDSTTETTKQMMTAAQDKKQKLEQDCAKLKKETDDKVAIQLDTAKKEAEQIIHQAELDAANRLDKASQEIDARTKKAEQYAAELDSNSRKLMADAQQREETAQRNVANSFAQLRQLGADIDKLISESK